MLCLQLLKTLGDIDSKQFFAMQSFHRNLHLGMDPGARHLVWSVLKPNGEDEVELPGT